MTTPYFSVVIPTKNRSALIAMAIQSVLRQSFADFELIIADNDDTDDTHAVVCSFADERLKYYRTGGLTMADNWESACRQASGRYLCLLEDKQLFKYGTLQRVHEVVEATGAQCLRWQSDSFSPYGLAYRVKQARGKGGTEEMSADSILTLLLNSTYGAAKRVLPLPQLSCIGMDLVREIQQSPLGRLCAPANPDYNMAFAQLAFCPSVLLIHEGLVVNANTSLSNGLAIRMKRGTFAATHGPEMVDRVPVKVVTISGSILNDYVRMREILRGRLDKHPINWVNYFLEVYTCIHTSRQMGIPMHEEEAEWSRALAQESSDIQRAVRSVVDRLLPRHGIKAITKQIRQKPAIRQLRSVLKSAYHHSLRGSPLWQFTHVMDYLEWEAGQPRSHTGR